jgi:hypothetical protein
MTYDPATDHPYPYALGMARETLRMIRSVAAVTLEHPAYAADRLRDIIERCDDAEARIAAVLAAGKAGA